MLYSSFHIHSVRHNKRLIHRHVVLLPPTNGTCTYAPSDDNIYQNTPRASKRAYSISCIATFLAKKIVAITYGVTWYYQIMFTESMT